MGIKLTKIKIYLTLQTFLVQSLKNKYFELVNFNFILDDVIYDFAKIKQRCPNFLNWR